MTSTKKDDSQRNQNIKVAARIRPINKTETQSGSVNILKSSNEKREIVVQEKNQTKTYTFDRVFGSNTKQIDVYKSMVSPLVDEVLQGYNCTIFAYGQTGTGKTFTMEGERTPNDKYTWHDDPLAGIIPRSCHQLFDSLIKQEIDFSVRVSFLEIYNEELIDLLSANDTQRLRIFEDSARKGSVLIQGLEEIAVQSRDEVYSIMERGAAKRTTAATLMNAQSSRSHSVFCITVHMKENTVDGEELVKTGKLYLVDLAGSESIGRSGAVDKRAREAGQINQSLLTLGRVISALVDRSSHIPYRESKLTRILQDSLGGRTKTSIIATVSPASINFEETVSTLDYAHRAKNITNKPEVNQKLTKKAMIREYTDEIEKLKRDLMAAREKTGIFVDAENYLKMSETIIQQKEQVKQYQEQIMCISQEIQKIQEIFEDTKEKLAQTSEELHKTTSDLMETKENLEQQKYLVSHHVNTETCLLSQGRQLVDTADLSTKDVAGLHEKVERKSRVERSNMERSQAYDSDMSEGISKVQRLVQEMADSRETMGDLMCGNFDSLQTNIEERTNSVSLNMEKIDATVNIGMENLRLILDKHLEWSGESSEGEKKRIQITHEICLGLVDDLKRKVSRDVADVRVMIQGLEGEAQADLGRMRGLVEEEESQWKRYVSQQRGHVQVLSENLRTHRDLCADTGASTGQCAASTRDKCITSTQHLDELLTQSMAQTVALHKQMVEVSEKIRDEVRGDCDRLVEIGLQHQERTSQLNTLATGECEALSSEMLVEAERRDETYRAFGGHLVEQGTKIDKHCGEVCAKMESLEDGFIETITELHESGITQQYASACNYVNTVRSNEENVHQEFIQSQKECEEVVSTGLGDTQSLLSELGLGLKSDCAGYKSEVEEDLVWAREWQESISGRVCEVVEGHRQYMDSLEQDVPTGTTPMRRVYAYPRDLATTGRHSLLLRDYKTNLALGLAEEEEEATPTTHDNASKDSTTESPAGTSTDGQELLNNGFSVLIDNDENVLPRKTLQYLHDSTKKLQSDPTTKSSQTDGSSRTKKRIPFAPVTN